MTGEWLPISGPDDPNLPPHLRASAPSQECSRCGRSTWSLSQFDEIDMLRQPDGAPCGGRFGKPKG